MRGSESRKKEKNGEGREERRRRTREEEEGVTKGDKGRKKEAKITESGSRETRRRIELKRLLHPNIAVAVIAVLLIDGGSDRRERPSHTWTSTLAAQTPAGARHLDVPSATVYSLVCPVEVQLIQ